MNILSLGAGWQSSVLYFASSMEMIPRYDAAIFADTGREHLGTYVFLEWLIGWQSRNNGIPIIWSRRKNLYQDLISTTHKFNGIPFYTKNADGSVGMLRRQCTSKYKIDVVVKEVRQLQGLKTKSKNKHVNLHIGLTVDELTRFSKNEIKAWDNVYPLAGGYVMSHNPATPKKIKEYDMAMHTLDCPTWLKKMGLPVPPRSSCTFCPYSSDNTWLQIKTDYPAEWEVLCEIDEKVRNSTARGVDGQVFLHRSCVPLREVVFITNQLQLNFECSGTCNT